MAAKEKQIFFCKECGYESAKWQGQCPGCHAWNTFVEESWRQRSGEATEGCSQSYGYFAGDNGGGKPRADRYAGIRPRAGRRDC